MASRRKKCFFFLCVGSQREIGQMDILVIKEKFEKRPKKHFNPTSPLKTDVSSTQPNSRVAVLYISYIKHTHHIHSKFVFPEKPLKIDKTTKKK